MPDRIAIGERPAAFEVHQRQQSLHGRLRIPIGPLELGAVAVRIIALRIGRGAEHRHDVEEAAVPQRIVHDVIAGPAPEHDLLPQHAVGKEPHRHDGAMRHIADEARRALVVELRADRGAETVGADECRPGVAAAIFGVHAHPRALVLESDHAR